ncbi:MAG: hypothetical protein AAGL98_02830 [Planctomycetota bacterium]
MSMFSRQPSLPPDRPTPGSAAPGNPRDSGPNQRAVPVGVATPQVLGHFAVVGVDTQTGQPVSTVIEARSENEAQQFAQQQGIIVDEFKPMHPLAGAAAVKMARSDPHDRFNQHPGYAEHARDVSTPPPPSSSANRLPQNRDFQRPLIDGPPAGTMGQVRRPQTSPLGAVAVLAVVGVLGGLLYVAVLKDGGARDLLAMLAAGPPSAEASIDIAEPVGVNLASIQGFEDWEYVNDLTADPAPGTADRADAADHAVSTGGKPVAAAATNRPGGLRLEAIIPPTTSGRGHRGSAVIGGQIVRPGGEISGYRLVLVRTQHVLLQKGDKLIALRMSSNKS